MFGDILSDLMRFFDLLEIFGNIIEKIKMEGLKN